MVDSGSLSPVRKQRTSMAQPSDDASLEALINEIRQQRPALESLGPRFRKRIEQFEALSNADLIRKSGLYWKAVAFGDSLVRIRLFLEQNFSHIETVGVLAVSRYLFELTVWLKVLQNDSRYGLVYYHQLLKKQLDYYTALRKRAEREILFLLQIDATETSLMARSLSEAMSISDEQARNVALRQVSSKVMHLIDQNASRDFSLYGEQAQTNGYAFQSHLVETQVLPKHSKAIEDIEQELRDFERGLPAEIKTLTSKRWKWNEQAERVGMKDEYDFIYLFASLLMHATPVSITTDQKNLEPEEMRAFLKYIRVRVADITEMAEELLKTPVLLQ